MALKPTCTLCTKFVGIPIGVDRELRRYKASSQVYSSELSRNSMQNVEVEYWITRQFCRLESGSIRVRLANGIFRVTPDAWKRMKQKYMIQKDSNTPWQPESFDWALLVSLSKYSVREPHFRSVLSRTGLRECLDLRVATENVEKMGLLRWWAQLVEADRMKGVNEGRWRCSQMRGGLL